jgi:hypothetical protein
MEALIWVVHLYRRTEQIKSTIQNKTILKMKINVEMKDETAIKFWQYTSFLVAMVILLLIGIKNFQSIGIKKETSTEIKTVIK